MNPDTLRQLIANCRRRSGRFLGFPRDWSPQRIPNPAMEGYYFSDDAAWELIANYLESGHPRTFVPLHTPPGALAVSMTITLPNCQQPLYVKVQVGPNCQAIGRSFHLSERY
jgi:hypothetical protein